MGRRSGARHDGWTIGKPDVGFTMTEDFNVPANGAVPYTYVAIPTNLRLRITSGALDRGGADGCMRRSAGL